MASGKIEYHKHYYFADVPANDPADYGTMLHNVCNKIRNEATVSAGECIFFSFSAQIPGQTTNSGPFYGIAFKTSQYVYIGKMFFAPITSQDLHLNWRDSSQDNIATYTLQTDGNAFITRGLIPNNSDLNDYGVFPGMYMINTSYTLANKPNSDCYFLLVFRAGKDIATVWQVCFGLGAIYYRVNSGGSWVAWRKITATTVS